MPNSVTIIGLGFVGLTTATFFANRGMKVYAVDSDIERIEAIKKIRIPFFEPKLDNFVKKALLSKMLLVNNDLYDGVKKSKFIFICVGTPMDQHGKADLTSITEVSKEIGTAIRNVSKYQVICVKSTVPPGTTENIILTQINKNKCKNSLY